MVTRDRGEKKRRDATRVKCHARLISPWEVGGLAPARPDLLPPAAPFLLYLSLFLVLIYVCSSARCGRRTPTITAIHPSDRRSISGRTRDILSPGLAGTRRVVSCRLVSCHVGHSSPLNRHHATPAVFDGADAEKKRRDRTRSYSDERIC